MKDVGVGDTRGNRSRGRSCWRWDGEFGLFYPGCSQWACSVFQGLEAAGDQTSRSTLRAVLAAAQRGVRSKGYKVWRALGLGHV